MAIVKNVSIAPEDLIKVAEKLYSIKNSMKKNFDGMSECIETVKEIWRDSNGIKFVSVYEKDVKDQLSSYYEEVERHSGYVLGAANAYRDFINETRASVGGAHYTKE